MVSWTSDRGDVIPDGANNVTAALTTVGDHLITVCAVDSTDSQLSGCATFVLTITANQPPTVTINAPNAGDPRI